MLSDFLHTLVEFAAFLWPVKVVHQWEAGLYVCAGRVVTPWAWVGLRRKPFASHILPAGLYLAVPWVCDVHTVTMTWDYVESGRMDVLLKDGRIVSCEALAKMRVVDPFVAYVEFGDFAMDRPRMLRAVVAETLAEAESDRFAPERRGRLLGSSLLKAVRDAAEPLGHEVETVQVTTFILQPKVLRLLTEQARF